MVWFAHLILHVRMPSTPPLRCARVVMCLAPPKIYRALEWIELDRAFDVNPFNGAKKLSPIPSRRIGYFAGRPDGRSIVCVGIGAGGPTGLGAVMWLSIAIMTPPLDGPICEHKLSRHHQQIHIPAHTPTRNPQTVQSDSLHGSFSPALLLALGMASKIGMDVMSLFCAASLSCVRPH